MHPNAIVSEHASISQEVEIDPYTIVDSHVRVGVFSFVAAVVLVNKDVLPYTIADGQWVSSRAVNKVSSNGLASLRRSDSISIGLSGSS